MNEQQKVSSLFTISSKTPTETWGQYYKRHEFQFGVLFFAAGFLWDVFTLSDVDDSFANLQQVLYLAFIGWALFYEVRHALGEWKPSPRMEKIWPYREFMLHFFLGSLISVYSLFFYKSASIASSFVFLAFIFALLVANEFPQLQSRGPLVRLALWTICLAAFYSSQVPLIFGFVGTAPFAIALIMTALVLWFYFKGLKRKVTEPNQRRLTQLFIPSGVVLILYLVAYILKLTPPVPISLKDIGIYHKVEKINNEYVFTEDRPWWRFWHNGDQSFVAKPGDRIYVFAAIHSPTKFSDEVRIRFLYRDRRGWTTSDLIPMKIVGGRSEGFRGVAYKSNYQKGDWRVQVETTDEREIGRIHFEVQ